MFRNSIPPPRPYSPPSFDDIFGNRDAGGGERVGGDRDAGGGERVGGNRDGGGGDRLGGDRRGLGIQEEDRVKQGWKL